MKKTFRGTQYDTEKATLIAHDQNRYLYQKKQGAFFLHIILPSGVEAVRTVSYGLAKIIYKELPIHKQDYETTFGEPEWFRWRT